MLEFVITVKCTKTASGKNIFLRSSPLTNLKNSNTPKIL